MRTRVKICGITRIEDARLAARLGADAVGLVFYPASPRAVSIEQACEIARALPPFVTVVGLFVDAREDEIRRTLAAVPLDLLQFHGDEPPDACRIYQRPYIKAVRMRAETDAGAQARRYADAAGLLLDAYREGVPGGTGEVFDWTRVPHAVDKPVILAGGLTPENIAAAIRQTRPWAVDVSGGVEAAKGIKSAEKITAFINEVNSVTS